MSEGANNEWRWKWVSGVRERMKLTWNCSLFRSHVDCSRSNQTRSQWVTVKTMSIDISLANSFFARWWNCSSFHLPMARRWFWIKSGSRSMTESANKEWQWKWVSGACERMKLTWDAIHFTRQWFWRWVFRALVILNWIRLDINE